VICIGVGGDSFRNRSLDELQMGLPGHGSVSATVIESYDLSCISPVGPRQSRTPQCWDIGVQKCSVGSSGSQVSKVKRDFLNTTMSQRIRFPNWRPFIVNVRQIKISSQSHGPKIPL